MDLKEIQDKLNTLLTGTERKLVFWYDDDGVYQDDIDKLELEPQNKIWKLTDDNWFETKLLLEERDTETNYLVYAPFPRPEDRENYLADIFYYAQHFYSDKLVQLMGDLEIPADCTEEMKRYKKFWSSGNVAKFKKLQIREYSKEAIDVGIMCVLASVKSYNFEELLKTVVLAGASDNPIIKKMEYYKIDSEFWSLCEKYYGYQDASPTVEDFMITMLVTYTDTLTEGNIPKVWKKYLSVKHNDVLVLVKNLMNNEESKKFYDDIAKRIAHELKVGSLVQEIPLQYVALCDTFEEFDRNLMSWMIAKIEDDMLDEKIAGMSIGELCESRSKTCYHFSKRYAAQYHMLYHAYMVLKKISLYFCQTTVRDIIEEYARETYLIDTHYRKFYYYMDKVGMSEHVEKIKELVENTYTNRYLADCTFKWNQSLTDEFYQTYTGERQEEFFRNYVQPFMREDGREGKVVVIISDGLLYECAKELLDNLDLDEKCDAKMYHMLSALPSETTLGMACLLPHKEITVDENLGIYVDGMPCGNSTKERQSILQSYIPRSICLEFDTVMAAKKEEIREYFKEKDVIYIYQNQIDIRGENVKSENEVFQACQEAIRELQELMHRITGYVSATRYLITSDHGFIYKRDKLKECDKISLDKKEISCVAKRYMLTYFESNHDALVSRGLAYLSSRNKIKVTTPKGMDIIKARGGGQNYVHGGSSLQEMVIPVVKVKTLTRKPVTGMVTVELSSFASKITNIEVRLEFMQMEPVSDTLKPRKIVAFFVDGQGRKISFNVPIIANVRDADARKRVIAEKFTLRSGKYRRGDDYFLVLADMEEEQQEYRRYKFEIDIAE